MINLRQHWKNAIDNAGMIQPQLQNSWGFKLNITLRCKAKEKKRKKKRAKQAGSHTTQKCFEASVPHQGEGGDTSRSTSPAEQGTGCQEPPRSDGLLFFLLRARRAALAAPADPACLCSPLVSQELGAVVGIPQKGGLFVSSWPTQLCFSVIWAFQSLLAG